MTKSSSIQLTLRLWKSAFTLSNGNLPVTSATFCSTVCYKDFYVASNSDFNLEIGTWNVSITSASAEAQLKIVSISLLDYFITQVYTLYRRDISIRVFFQYSV